MRGKFFFLMGILLLPILALAQVVDPSVPIKDVFTDIADLVNNWKGLSGVGVSASVVMILIKLLSTDIVKAFISGLSPKIGNILDYKRVLVTVLGQISGILMAVNGGLSFIDAIVAGLLTSGGAVAIYEALKPFFKKA